MASGKPERPGPRKLPENEGCSFQGWNDLDWSPVPLPGYLPAQGGKEVNTHPEQKPHRYARPNKRKTGLEDALAPMERCLVTACVARHLCFSFQPTDRIFSGQLYVFPLPSFTSFAVLQSRVHEVWVRLLAVSKGWSNAGLAYAADCFVTFPFPHGSPKQECVTLEAAGEVLYTERARYMADTQQGLTKLYNALPEPLRELHENMDRAVLDAYGWEDLYVPPWGVKDRDWEREVVKRLYELNAVRACERYACFDGGMHYGLR